MARHKNTAETASGERSGRPLRVCFMIEELKPAGTELWILRAIESLDRRIVQPYLCLLEGTSDISRSLEPQDCPVLSLGITNIKRPAAWRAMGRLIAFLRRERIDVLQVHHATPMYVGVVAGSFAGVPHIVQTKYSVGYWLRGVDLWLHRLLNRFVDVTIANCHACKLAAQQQERASADRIVVLENGITLPEYEPVAQQRDFQGDHAGQSVGMVANLRAVKDPETFVRAARLVVDRFPRAEFHLAGDGPLRGSLNSLIRELKLDGQVILHGSVTDVPRFLEHIDIGVLCSLSEGLPHVLMEYMAAKLPIVATNVGGNPELIDDEVTGSLVEPGDAVGLANAIGRFLSDREFAQRCADAAHQRVHQHYSTEAMLQRFEAFYTALQTHGASGIVPYLRAHFASPPRERARQVSAQAALMP